jgi:hypothetical protein
VEGDVRGVSVRFGDLEGLTSLPIEQVRDRFRNEEVLTVLPVRAAGSSRDGLLVATTTMLAILTGDVRPTREWMTRWAPWDGVRFADMGATVEGEDMFFLTIVVDRLRFHAELHGESGRRALRDFVVAVEATRAAIAATW